MLHRQCFIDDMQQAALAAPFLFNVQRALGGNVYLYRFAARPEPLQHYRPNLRHGLPLDAAQPLDGFRNIAASRAGNGF